MVRVLLVDDYEMFRIQLRRTLVTLGFSGIEEATNGAEALQMLEEGSREGKPYSLLLLDLNMPKMNGFEVLQSLRGNLKFGNPQVVVISAEAETEYREQAIARGAIDYIMKPIDPIQLKEKLARISQLLKP